MMMSKKHAKWREIRKESETNLSVGPIVTQAQVNRLYRNTQVGSPVDTFEEYDIQKNNLGPKDSVIEQSDLKTQPEMKPSADAIEVKDDNSTEENNEHLSPAPRPKWGLPG